MKARHQPLPYGDELMMMRAADAAGITTNAFTAASGLGRKLMKRIQSETRLLKTTQTKKALGLASQGTAQKAGSGRKRILTGSRLPKKTAQKG